MYPVPERRLPAWQDGQAHLTGPSRTCPDTHPRLLCTLPKVMTEAKLNHPFRPYVTLRMRTTESCVNTILLRVVQIVIRNRVYLGR